MISRFGLLIGLALGAAQTLAGASNHVEDFRLYHGASQDRVEFHGTMGYLDQRGLVISASEVTMALEQGTRRRLFLCANFRADLRTGFYVCDNRDMRRSSFILDRNLNLKTY